MTEQPVQQELPPKKIAFVIDGVVEDILHTDVRLAAIFLSEPVIVDVTDSELEITIGLNYDAETNTFGPKITH
jgi:hypothetical protein